MDRALASGARGRRFESCRAYHFTKTKLSAGAAVYYFNTVIQFILKVLLVVLALRVLASFFRPLRGDGGKKQFSGRDSDQDRVKKPAYEDLTPYEIEDAEYEDISNEER